MRLAKEFGTQRTLGNIDPLRLFMRHLYPK